MSQGPVSRYLPRAQPSSKGTSRNSLDMEAIGQAHISAVAGACFAIGLKFAGSADAAAEGVLRHYVLYFLEAKQQAPDSAAGETCSCCCIPFCSESTGVVLSKLVICDQFERLLLDSVCSW